MLRIIFDLFEKGDYLAAIEEYTKCFEINPIAIQARFEICESYIQLREFNKAKEELFNLSKLITRSKDAAHFYRRYGFIAVEEGKYSLAVACFRYSLSFEQNDIAVQEERYIEHITKRKFVFLNITKEFKIHKVPMIDKKDIKEINS